jgi:hypothetical protein
VYKRQEQILTAGCAMVNCVPVFIAREPYWQKLSGDLLATAQARVNTSFDPTTHGYIGPPPPPPSTKAFSKVYKPTVSGKAQVGKTLKAKVKASKPAATSRTWQWLRNGVPIAGATHSSYKITGSDNRAKITATVTIVRAGYTTITKASKATKAVTAGVQAKGTVRVVGTTRVGKTLTAKTSKWSPTATLRFQWYRSGKKIIGATDRTYMLAVLDKGKRLRVTVRAYKSGYKMTSQSSTYTKKVGGQLTIPDPGR